MLSNFYQKIKIWNYRRHVTQWKLLSLMLLTQQHCRYVLREKLFYPNLSWSSSVNLVAFPNHGPRVSTWNERRICRLCFRKVAVSAAVLSKNIVYPIVSLFIKSVKRLCHCFSFRKATEVQAKRTYNNWFGGNVKFFLKNRYEFTHRVTLDSHPSSQIFTLAFNCPYLSVNEF